MGEEVGSILKESNDHLSVMPQSYKDATVLWCLLPNLKKRKKYNLDFISQIQGAGLETGLSTEVIKHTSWRREKKARKSPCVLSFQTASP